MREAEFAAFLRGGYRSPITGTNLSAAAAGDAVSRCRRIERALGIDLERALRRDEDVDRFAEKIKTSTRFQIAGDTAVGLNSIVRALRLYGVFKGLSYRPNIMYVRRG